jgi:hypothetical protein
MGTVELVAKAAAGQCSVDRLGGEDRVDRLGACRRSTSRPAFSLGAVEILG